MGIRYLARQRALQFLYTVEFAHSDDTFEQLERRFLSLDSAQRRGWSPFARELAETVFKHHRELDEKIKPLLRNWTIERLPKMDLLCLRMALAEMRYFPDIPLRVTINEYIDLARMFSTDDSPQYINAVLDHLAREFPQKDFQAGAPGARRPDEEGETEDDADIPDEDEDAEA